MNKEHNREKRERSLFDLINTKLVDQKDSNGPKLEFLRRNKKETILSKDNSIGTSSSCRQKLDGKSQEKSLKLEGVKTYEEIRRTEKEITRLEQSVNRHKSSSDKAILNRKLHQQQSYLKQLKSREKSINQVQSRTTNRKKLEIF